MIELTRPTRTVIRCLACGCSEVRTDEVIDRGLVFLAECSRCRHRWTSEQPIGASWEPERQVVGAERPEEHEQQSYDSAA